MAHDDRSEWIRMLQQQLAAEKKKAEKLEEENAQLRDKKDTYLTIIDGGGFRYPFMRLEDREAFDLIDGLEKKVAKLSRRVHILKDALRVSRDPDRMVWGDRPEMWGEE